MKSLHRAVKVTIAVTSALFVLLVAYFSYLIIFKGTEWKNDIHNLDALKTSAVPGEILDRSGAVIASSDENNRRVYLEDDTSRFAFANVTGDYYGVVQNSIENKYMNELYNLQSSWLGVNKLDRRQGDDVYLTLSYDLQVMAYKKLQENGGRGAVVLLNYKTGELLASASSPTFDPKDPSNLEVEDGNYTNRCLEAFTPGSVMKTVTLVSALETDPSVLPTNYNCTGHSDVEGVDLNDNGTHGNLPTFSEALEVSCNTYFGRVAVLMDGKLESGAEKMLFNNSLSLDRLSVAESHIELGEKSTQDIYSSGFGQSDVVASPLHLAMIYGAIANDGIMIKPHIVKSFGDPDGNIEETELSTELTTICSSETAALTKSALRSVITESYSRYAGSSKFKIYGKSGTAERENGNHAWFVSFCTEEDAGPYVCCVLLENYDESGGRTAGPICRDMLEAAVSGGY